MVKIVDVEGIKEYQSALIALYVDCFSEPPWYEIIKVDEAGKWFGEMLTYPKSIAVLFIEDNVPIGATFSFPILYKKDVAVYVDKNISQMNVLYFSEIFVEKNHRQRGIGTLLQHKTLEIGKNKGFTHAVSRTNFDSKMFPIFKREFQIIGEQDVVSLKEIDGKKIEVPDKRGIFLKNL